MEKTIKYYPNSWFKVEYEVEDSTVHFKAWKIQSLDEKNIEKSVLSDTIPNLVGSLKWDGCMNFKQNDHYCGIYNAKQILTLMSEIYGFTRGLGDPFDEVNPIIMTERGVIDELIDQDDPEIKQMYFGWDKGDCSLVGLVELYLYQCIKKHKSEKWGTL